MTKQIIIADAGPLIAFGTIKHINLISRTAGNILIPNAVANECLQDSSKSGAKEIANAINTGRIQISDAANPDSHTALFNLLGEGEASAIILALEKKSPILIDDKLGRRTAKDLNVPMIGTAGILLLAKKKKYINELKPILMKLQQSGYYFSDKLVKEILKLCHEK